MLKEHGIDTQNLGEQVFAGGHDKAALAVLQGQVEAGAIGKDVIPRLASTYPNADKELRIIEETPDIPNDGVAFRKGLSPEIVEKICGAAADDGRVRSESYPLALGRLWSALHGPRTGDLLISASSGSEFVDWGGIAHVGGGSHGALSRGDSLGALITCGLDPPPGGRPQQWAIADVAPLVLHHFSLPS